MEWSTPLSFGCANCGDGIWRYRSKVISLSLSWYTVVKYRPSHKCLITTHSWDIVIAWSQDVSRWLPGPYNRRAVVGRTLLQDPDNYGTFIMQVVISTPMQPFPTSWKSRTFHASRNWKFWLECIQQQLWAGPGQCISDRDITIMQSSSMPMMLVTSGSTTLYWTEQRIKRAAMTWCLKSIYLTKEFQKRPH